MRIEASALDVVVETSDMGTLVAQSLLAEIASVEGLEVKSGLSPLMELTMADLPSNPDSPPPGSLDLASPILRSGSELASSSDTAGELVLLSPPVMVSVGDEVSARTQGKSATLPLLTAPNLDLSDVVSLSSTETGRVTDEVVDRPEMKVQPVVEVNRTLAEEMLGSASNPVGDDLVSTAIQVSRELLAGIIENVLGEKDALVVGRERE